ncbi:hypothetical protein C0993_005563 [Termitomyces sp. T159_Od127]|nr:hypothetical protein C0993_005563 [Termitomyces sp. T159_Od127]
MLQVRLIYTPFYWTCSYNDLIDTASQPVISRPNLDPDAPDEEEGEAMDAENEDDTAMMALMGLTGFGSTKGKAVEGNQEGGVFLKKQRTWRQYMNRRGGFNRPVSLHLMFEALLTHQQTFGQDQRKRPPTFRHLPANRAKKLKQAWIENKKIKTKWKAQKFREGITSTPQIQDELKRSDDEDESDVEPGTDDPERDVSEGDGHEETVSESEEKPEPKKSTLHPSRSHIHPELAPSKTKRPRVSEIDSTSQSPSLRELTRQAYSRESLHTFKAGQKRSGVAQVRGGGQGAGRRASGGVTGRGQPNMKLRMGAMLEKIKQSME